MDTKHLPIGVRDFRSLREGGFYYVDKTPHIDLIMRTKRKHFFLSRPRGFGKSLFVDTLKEAFEGRRELFEGLAIYNTWDWSAGHPVIRLDYSDGDFLDPDGLAKVTNEQLEKAEADAGLESSELHPDIRLHKLICRLYAKTGQRVVLLVDEYDRPITDAAEHPEIAAANCYLLTAIYGMVRVADNRIRMSFLTGVTKSLRELPLAEASNHEDITLDPEHSAICGFTEADIDTVFGREAEGLDREGMRDRYGGYSWRGGEMAYSPHDILLSLKH